MWMELIRLSGRRSSSLIVMNSILSTASNREFFFVWSSLDLPRFSRWLIVTLGYWSRLFRLVPYLSRRLEFVIAVSACDNDISRAESDLHFYVAIQYNPGLWTDERRRNRILYVVLIVPHIAKFFGRNREVTFSSVCSQSRSLGLFRRNF